MEIAGQWLECDDGIIRPVVRGELQRSDGGWEPEVFLLDTGADRTVLCGAVVSALGLTVSPASDLGGLGATIESVSLRTELRLTKTDGAPVILRGKFAAFTDPAVLDMYYAI